MPHQFMRKITMPIILLAAGTTASAALAVMTHQATKPPSNEKLLKEFVANN